MDTPRRLLLIAVLVGVTTLSMAQPAIDSLFQVAEDQRRPDTVRLKAFRQFIWDGYLFSRPDTAEIMARELYMRAQRAGEREYMGQGLNIQGISSYLRGQLDTALARYEAALAIYEGIPSNEGISSMLSNMSMIHVDRGDYARAMECNMRSLKMDEASGNKSSISASLNQIGVLYQEMHENERALDHFQRSLKAAEETGDTAMVMARRKNVALMLGAMGHHDEAIALYEQDLAAMERSADLGSLAVSLNGLGVNWNMKGDPVKALYYHRRSLAACQAQGDKACMALSYINQAAILHDQGDDAQAAELGRKGLALAQEVGDAAKIREAANDLYNIHKSIGRPGDALAMLELSTLMKDSLTREENRRGVMQQRFQYEYEKKEAAAKAEQDKKDAVAAEELRRRNLQRNASIGGFLLMLALAGTFLFQRNRINTEKKRSDELLLNILPEEVADELKATGAAEAKHFDTATILFTDFKGFTQLSEKVTPAELVEELNTCFKAFDGITGKYSIEKIKTIGDAYMAAGGLPDPQQGSAAEVVRAAMEMQAFMKRHKAEREAAGKPFFEMRVGIHTGPVVAGIVGVKKFQYDIWGDTVNTASRMESSGEVGQVNISEATYALVKNETGLTFTSRGKVQAKGKGEMEMYFVEKA